MVLITFEDDVCVAYNNTNSVNDLLSYWSLNKNDVHFVVQNIRTKECVVYPLSKLKYVETGIVTEYIIDTSTPISPSEPNILLGPIIQEKRIITFGKGGDPNFVDKAPIGITTNEHTTNKVLSIEFKDGRSIQTKAFRDLGMAFDFVESNIEYNLLFVSLELLDGSSTLAFKLKDIKHITPIRDDDTVKEVI